MAIQPLTHAVIYVRDVARSTSFYGEVLGFRVVAAFPGAAFLQADRSTNDHDLGLFEIGGGGAGSDAGRRAVGLYHLAWEVETLGDLQRLEILLRERGAFVGASNHGTTKSLYAEDPDGIQFEIVWIIPAELLTDEDLAARASAGPLDLAGEIARFGLDEPSGVGVSSPVTVPALGDLPESELTS